MPRYTALKPPAVPNVPAPTPKTKAGNALAEGEEPEVIKATDDAASDTDLVKELRDRYDIASTAESNLRLLAVEDIRFVYDEEGQWTTDTRQKREGRPCYSFNKVAQVVDQVVGDQRQNRPGIKIRATEGEGDQKIAETYTGLIRNIESASDAATAYDIAFEFATAGGYGAWRIETDYAHDSTFDQDIFIRPIVNPFTTYSDPDARDFQKRDARYWIVTSEVPKKQFEAEWPDADTAGFDGKTIGEQMQGWYDGDNIRIAEYWRKEPETKTLLLLSDGRTIDKDEDADALEEILSQPGQDGKPVTIERERKVQSYCIYCYKCTALEVLERKKWAGKFIPIVPVYGKRINIEGEDKYRGVVRFAKDAQRVYNYMRSTLVEAVALTPKAPYMATPKMLEGFEQQWKKAHVKNYPVLMYNYDKDAPGGKPSREPPVEVQSGLYAEVKQSDYDIQATTGMYKPSLGAEGQEVSGKAILARQREGDVGTFAFVDNLSRALKHTGEILVDLIPRIYDTERQLRILGADGNEDFVTVNQTVIDPRTGKETIVNDLSQGRYDVSITTGPSYTTARQEAAEQLMDLLKIDPQIAAAISDLLVKWLDMPGAQELEKRLRLIGIKQGYIQQGPDDEMPQPSQDQTDEANLAKQAAAAKLHEIITRIGKMESEIQLNRTSGALDMAQVQKIVAEALDQQLNNRIKAGLFSATGGTGGDPVPQVTVPIR